MLNALTAERHQILFDLTTALLGLFVQWNANQAIWCSHRTTGQSCVFTFDVKIANFLEIEQFFINFAQQSIRPR